MVQEKGIRESFLVFSALRGASGEPVRSPSKLIATGKNHLEIGSFSAGFSDQVLFGADLLLIRNPETFRADQPSDLKTSPYFMQRGEWLALLPKPPSSNMFP